MIPIDGIDDEPTGSREDRRVADSLDLRRGVRAVVVDTADRILLVRFEFPPHFTHQRVWATPGGGVEEGEDEIEALRRELAEELGLDDPDIGPVIWTRTHVFPMSNGQDGQQERFHLVRTPPFEPQPGLTEAELRAEHVTGIRWWTVDELAASDEVFAPRRLAELVRSLLVEGPPAAPIDTGV